MIRFASLKVLCSAMTADAGKRRISNRSCQIDHEVIYGRLFRKTGFEKQLVWQLSGWIVYKWVCAVQAHTHLFLWPVCR